MSGETGLNCVSLTAVSVNFTVKNVACLMNILVCF